MVFSRAPKVFLKMGIQMENRERGGYYVEKQNSFVCFSVINNLCVVKRNLNVCNAHRF
jgi:hypothetical protein